MFENIVLYTKNYFYKFDVFVKSYGNWLLKLIKIYAFFNFIILPLLIVFSNFLNLNEFCEKLNILLFPSKFTCDLDYLYLLLLSGHFPYILSKFFSIFYDFFTFNGGINESMLSLSWFINDINIYTYYTNIIDSLTSCIFDFQNFFVNFFSGFYHNNELPLFFYFGLLFVMSTVISLLLMSYLGLYGVFFINLITIFCFWLSTVYYIDEFFLKNNFFKINVGKWFTIMLNTDIYFELLIDSISYSFMLLTVTIATFVYIYIFSYFRYDANVERLTIFINLFVISMVLLVTSGNLFVMFLGWELIGLTSFFLINFWSSRISTLKSAFKAYVFNKFSDVSILIAVLLCFLITNDINIMVFNNQISLFNNYYLSFFNVDVSVIELISFFFISAAFIKSAQFGAHIWLPDSMEAPVPASALIHSATLVSAGVFLLLRLSPLFELSYYAYIVIPTIGAFTAFFGGLCAAYQSDIKRILAYSTISHCGFLMVCYSTYVPEYTILYLYIHGFFKAAVFLCAGNIIRFSRNYQDFRRMGGFWKYLPFECFASFVCLINLCGMPFSIGFYIKHLILIGVGVDYYFMNFILVNILGGALFGIFYSYKFFYYVFFDIRKAKKIIYVQANRSTLKSYYYSNTSLASNIAIICLIIVSYIISMYLLNIFLNKTSIGEGLDIYSMYNSAYSEFTLPTKALLLNIGFFNWLLVFIMFVVCFSTWRNTSHSHVIFKNFNIVITFLILTSMFYYIIL
jgi:NADH:ubiquinone oxidoreductase subunit 5 (subunit L)/multisubunit Na+/H+ antiporter MnhA subunit